MMEPVVGSPWSVVGKRIGWALVAGGLMAHAADAEVEVRKIWDEAKHCAFTDMERWEGACYVAFRESDAHVYGADGKTRVIRSTDGEQWDSVALLAKEGVDLRDPKLSVTPDGRLMVLQGGSEYDGRTLKGRLPYVAFREKGKASFGPLTPIEIDASIRTGNDWLWRVTWHGETGYGVIYQPGEERQGLHLVKTGDGIGYELVKSFDIPGRPGESTVRFAPDGAMWVVVRNEGDDRMGLIGRSREPFTEWSWSKLPVRLGGPDLLRLTDGTWLLATRKYAPGGAKTMIGKVTAEGGFEERVELPSGGDTSYPRMTEVEGKLWVSYYSSHGGKAEIYLAKVPLADVR